VSKVFIDTNILIYSIDERDQAKKRRARDVLASLGAPRIPVISTQVVQEYFVVATRKLNIEPLAAKKLVYGLRRVETVINTLDLIEQAVDICVLEQLSFWDSLIVAAAEKANCEVILSEDMSRGGIYRGMTVINPLIEGSF
jgi:predicted nucleic acid-binding protein